jgi:hypothetical protein
MKLCRKCLVEKLRSDFYRETSRKDGLHPWCKGCTREYGRVYRGRVGRRELDKIRLIKFNYGLSEEEYRSMAQAQSGHCAICRLPETADNKLQVEHDHQTGRVRGLAHRKCNSGIAFFFENPVSLMGAIEYLSVGEVS